MILTLYFSQKTEKGMFLFFPQKTSVCLVEEHNFRMVTFVAGLPVVSVINRFELAHVPFTPMKMALEMRPVEEVERLRKGLLLSLLVFSRAGGPRILSWEGTWTPED